MLHPHKVESTGPPWPKMENRETPEQSSLSASECDLVKGREGILGFVPCRKWKVGLSFVLDGGSECNSLK